MTVINMFFILGMTWTLEILSWSLMIYDKSNTILQVLTSFFDFINSLQGVILVCVLYFNSANLKKMKRWIGKRRNTRNISIFGRQISSGTANSTNLTNHTNVAHSANTIRVLGVTKSKEVNV